jgi:hypothetical protein
MDALHEVYEKEMYTIEKMEWNLHRSMEATGLPPYNDVNFKLKWEF